MAVVSDKTVSQKTIIYMDTSGMQATLQPQTHLYKYVDKRLGKTYLYVAHTKIAPDVDITDAKWVFRIISRVNADGHTIDLATVRSHIVPRRPRKTRREPCILINISEDKYWLHKRYGGKLEDIKASRIEYAVKNVIAIDQGLMLVPGQCDFRNQIEHLKSQCTFSHWWQDR